MDLQLTEGLHRQLRRAPDAEAAVFGARRQSWRELADRSARLATVRIGAGMAPNDRVAMLALWLRSGDMGFVDEEGYLFIVDRPKDMIVSGGENIYSAEVENALARHPAIASCAVIAVPSERWGEQVHAVVVLRAGAQTNIEQLREHCRGFTAGYKCPVSVEFRDALPLSAAGKLLKHVLRAPYWEGRSRNVG